MEFLKNNFEKLILLLLAVLLAVVSVLVILQMRGFSTSLKQLSGQAIDGKPPASVPTDDLDAALATFDKPAQWNSPHPILVSRPYLVREGRLVDVQEDESIKIHPPVPNQWFLSHNLDILDSSILSRDADEDGFTNLEEFEAGTNPIDKAAHPPYYTKLRLESYTQKDFRILFAQRTGQTFQIETIDSPRPTQFLKLGDTIKGTNFEIAKFEEKFITNPATGGQTDKSELIIRDKETGREIKLVIEQVANDPDSSAMLRDLWAAKSFKLAKGEEFALEQDANSKYLLVDVNPEQAVIRDLSSGKEITLPKLEATSK